MAKGSTATAEASEAPVSDLIASMAVEEEVTVPLRGRGFDPDVIAIRAELEKSLEEGTARSFPNCADDKYRETLSRKVRTAGEKMTGKPEIKVSTRFDKSNNKLIWGPKSVLDALANKHKAPKAS
jgi:hypothetical protein